MPPLQGINVYTHGEMLPGHGYPELHKYPHLVGNYGGAWYRQRRDFAEFPGPILMTTNCVVDPPQSYAGALPPEHAAVLSSVVLLTAGAVSLVAKQGGVHTIRAASDRTG